MPITSERLDVLKRFITGFEENGHKAYSVQKTFGMSAISAQE